MTWSASAAGALARHCPPTPEPRIENTGRTAALHWQAPERERLGDWLLRAAGGFTGRANSALPLGDPGVRLPEAVAVAEDWYRRRALPPTIVVQGSCTKALLPVPRKTFWPNEAGYPAPAPRSS